MNFELMEKLMPYVVIGGSLVWLALLGFCVWVVINIMNVYVI